MSSGQLPQNATVHHNLHFILISFDRLTHSRAFCYFDWAFKTFSLCQFSTLEPSVVLHAIRRNSKFQAFKAFYQSTCNVNLPVTAPLLIFCVTSCQASLLPLYQIRLPFALIHVDGPAWNTLPLWEANPHPSLKAQPEMLLSINSSPSSTLTTWSYLLILSSSELFWHLYTQIQCQAFACVQSNF